jgi:2-dehydropantoate 2-reductase
MGAGAMGAYFVTQFLESGEFETSVIARGKRADRLAEHGLVVNGQTYTIPVTSPDDNVEPADFIIVAVKNYHLPAAAPDLKHLVGEHTTILTVMNGLDSEEYLGSIYGMDKLLYAVSVAIDAVRDGNQITYSKPGKHYFGQANNSQISPQVQQVQAAFKRAGIAYETPIDMMRMLWWKFMVNVGMNQASAVMRAPYGVFQTSPDAQALMEALMLEVVQIAEPAGVDLKESDIQDWYKALNTLAPEGKTSMLQDIEAGRKTEVDTFAGKVVDLGKKYGMATPANETVLWIIRVLESASVVDRILSSTKD